MQPIPPSRKASGELIDKKNALKDKLIEQNRAMQVLLDGLSASIFSVDTNYCYTAFNCIHAQRMQTMYGVHIEIGQSLLECTTTLEDRETAKRNLDRALAGEHFIESEYSVDKSGEESFFDIRYSSIKNKNSEISGVNVYAENVTDFKKSKNALNAVAAEYHSLFEDLNSVILVIDPVTAVILDANQTACTFYGYSHSELTSLKITDISALPQEETFARVRKVAKGELSEMRHVHRLANGEIRDVEIYAGSINFDGHQANIAFVHDITERIATEVALMVSEKHYRSVFASMSEGIVVHDSGGAIISCNTSAENILGLTADQIYGRTPLEPNWQATHEDGSPFRTEEMPVSITLQTGKPCKNVVMGIHLPDDSFKWILINSEPVFLENPSNPNSALTTFTDITELKITEDKLRENEERSREILENVQDAPYRRNLHTDKYDYISQAIERMSGFTAEETIAMTTDKVLAHMHTDDLAAIEQAINESIANPGKSYQVEYRFKHRRTNQYRWFQDCFTTTLDEQSHTAFRYGSVRDITNQQIIEEAKKEAEFRYRSLFEQSHDAIFILDLQGAHLDANKHAADMMGYSIEEMRELSVNETSAELQQSQQVIEQLIRGEHVPLYERLFKKKDGNVFPVEINVELVRNMHGNPLHIQSVVRDISKRRLAEEKLRESEEKYRSFVENSFDGITFVNELGNITEWNRAAENLTGLKKENVFGKPYWDIQIQLTIPEHRTPEYVEKIKSNMLEIIQTGQSPLFNHIHTAEFIRADGSRRTVEQITFPVKKENGYGVRSMARDVTERRIAEEKLRESEERFRLLFENSRATMLIVDPHNGQIVDANPAATNYYGYSLDQLRGMPINKINTLPPETIHTELQHAAQEERNFFVFPHRLASGEMRTVEVHSSPINIKGMQVLFSIIHDITKRKVAEEKLIESEERFSTAFHSSQESISISRLSDGTYIDVNDAFCSIFEISRGQVIGRTNKELNFWANPEQRAELFNTIREKGSVPNFEAEYRSRTGRTGFMHASMACINISGEECVLIFGRDVTAQKKAEAELRAAHEELEQRVRERTAELQTAIASLEKAAQVKDEFLSIMGHELRTPLNVMLGSAQLLEEEVYGSLNDKQITAVTSIETSGEKLLKLLNNILDLSKLQNKDTSLNMVSCSLGDICRSVLESTKNASEKKQLQVNFFTTPDEIMVHADKLRVEQIIFNLYSNAIKFTPTGGKIGIDIIGSLENKNVKVTIWDTGIGIQNEDLPHLFQPFTQLDARLARDYDGSGLGLALSKQLAQLFGGNITVESVFGQGSRFTVTLPWMK